MLRTGLRIFFVILALSAIIVGYFYFFERNKNVPDVMQIFADNGIVMRINRPDKINDALESAHYLKYNHSKDSLLKNAAGALEQITRNEQIKKTYVVLEASDTAMTPLIVFRNYSFAHARSLVNYLKEDFFKQKKVVAKSNERINYYAVYQNGQPVMYFADKNGLVLLSHNMTILESGLAKIDQHVQKRPKLHLLKTANDAVVANLFIRPAELNEQWQPVLFQNNDTTTGLPGILILDIYLKPDNIVISGLSSPADNTPGAFIATKNNRKFNVADIVPEDAGILYQIAADGLFKYVHETDRFDEQIYQWLKEWSANEIVYFNTPKGYGIGLKAKGESVARTALEKYYEKLDENTDVERFRFDKATEFDIATGTHRWAGNILPSLVQKKSDWQYMTAAGTYIVLTTEKKLIRQVCRSTVLQQNLKSNYRFRQQADELSSSSNMMIYSRFDPTTMENMLQAPVVTLLKQTGIFKMFDAFAWQMSGSGKHLYNHIVFFSAGRKTQTQNIQWKTKLRSSASLKPVIVKNHDTNADEIFVQDKDHYIYLINRKGRILWRKKLRSQIISKVFQVDKYKNNKLQYLFNTKEKVFLIDRNGNDVERFPIDLPVNASAGLSVFDYEKNRNYRVFIPLTDKRIRLYDIDANIVAGWQFEKADAVVTTPVQHFRFGNKDYIVFADTIRHYILNRRGQHRVKPDKLIGKSVNNRIYFNDREARWVSTSPKGKVLHIGLSGDVDVFQSTNLSAKHYFLYADLTRDGHSDYIFTDQKTLTVYNHHFKTVFDFTFSNRITEPPVIYRFSRRKAGLGIVNKKAGKVYMFNRSGKQFKGFPYPGITPFTITHISGYRGFQLIVGNYDGFLYDYQLP